jgi:UDP-glucose 4-epimerase
MMFIRENASERLNYFNIGAGDTGITVQDIAEQVVKTVAPDASITYGQDNKGWVGDVPKFSYSVDKLNKLGWKPRMDSVEAVCHAVRQIAEQEMHE